MRLWHEALIPYLPKHQLLGQHRECCALRGAGWGKSHSTVNYVFEHPYEDLFIYHKRVIKEMQRRGYKVDPRWLFPAYRGASVPAIIYYDPCDGLPSSFVVRRTKETWYRSKSFLVCADKKAAKGEYVYPEHDHFYLDSCLENLESKGHNLWFVQDNLLRKEGLL